MKPKISCFLGFLLSVFLAQANSVSAGLNYEDFYFFDANGRIERPALVPKIFLRFKSAGALGESTALFSKLPPVKSKEQAFGRATDLVVSFVESPDINGVIQAIETVNASGLAEASPVFLFQNIEVVVDGFFVEPKSLVGKEVLLNRLKQYGKFEADVEQTSAIVEGGIFRFNISAVYEPLNVFRLMNLAHKDSWVIRAYPSFGFLHDAITASFLVEPASGTVGEERALILEVKIFDPQIRFRGDLMPSFGSGKFIPMVENKLPAPYLFETVGEVSKEETEAERGRIVKLSWRFRQFSVGLARISDGSIPVPYERNGLEGKIEIPGPSLVTASLVKDLSIKEMPLAKVLEPLESKFEPAALAIQPAPVYWFDGLPVPAPILASLGLSVSALSFLLIFVFAAKDVFVRVSEARARRNLFSDFCAKADLVCLSAVNVPDRAHVEKLEKLFYLVLHTAFPRLSRHPTKKELEETKIDSKSLWDSFGPKIRQDLERVYARIEEMYGPDFQPDAEAVKDFSDAVSRLSDDLKEEIKRSLK